MAYISPRIVALGTVGVVASLTLASGVVFGLFSQTGNEPGDICDTEETYHPGYGYGYMCTPGGGSGGPSGGSAPTTPTTPTTPATPATPTKPETILFPSVHSLCGHEVRSLADERLKKFYDVLQIQNRVNAEGRTLTRAEFLKLVLNAAKVDVSSASDGVFSDVPASHSLAKYVNYAANMKIVSGQGNMFRPNDSISRAEAMKVLLNVTNIQFSSSAVSFADVSTSHSLAAYIQTAKENCVVHGVTPTQFEPNRGITVAETAKVLYNVTEVARK